MVFLNLFVKIMLQYINHEIDNSHFCDSRVCSSIYGCFCPLFMRKFMQKHPYNWEVLFSSFKSVGLVKGDSMTFFTAFCDINSWNSTRNPYIFVSFASVLKTKVSGKQSHCHTQYSRFNSMITLRYTELRHFTYGTRPTFAKPPPTQPQLLTSSLQVNTVHLKPRCIYISLPTRTVDWT